MSHCTKRSRSEEISPGGWGGVRWLMRNIKSINAMLAGGGGWPKTRETKEVPVALLLHNCTGTQHPHLCHNLDTFVDILSSFYLQQKKGTRSKAVEHAGNVAQKVQTLTTLCSATAWQQQLWCAIWWSDLRYDFNLWQLPSDTDTMLYNENVGLEMGPVTTSQ